MTTTMYRKNSNVVESMALNVVQHSAVYATGIIKIMPICGVIIYPSKVRNLSVTQFNSILFFLAPTYNKSDLKRLYIVW